MWFKFIFKSKSSFSCYVENRLGKVGVVGKDGSSEISSNLREYDVDLVFICSCGNDGLWRVVFCFFFCVVFVFDWCDYFFVCNVCVFCEEVL